MDNTPGVYDEIDYLIIKSLRKDPRMSSGKIAKEIGINERTARRRIDNLVDSGAIRFSTICSAPKFGYNNILDVNLLIDAKHYDSAFDILVENPAICYISKGWGENGVTVQCKFKSSDEINQFLHSFLAKIDGVTIESYYFEAKILRDADSWEPQESDFAKSIRIVPEKK